MVLIETKSGVGGRPRPASAGTRRARLPRHAQAGFGLKLSEGETVRDFPEDLGERSTQGAADRGEQL